ncbi:hypothetical protein DFR70_106414 [Nocardia tenerifensis]|uniref:Uncharacterized protein n=1 Tax=Nocardia tenerifensis TaxID=228006 RepID=A0A318K3N1_9NOCA|nr:hypothetical protein DFR70_106414 [Nocardia tenerifensis]
MTARRREEGTQRTTGNRANDLFQLAIEIHSRYHRWSHAQLH